MQARWTLGPRPRTALRRTRYPTLRFPPRPNSAALLSPETPSHLDDGPVDPPLSLRFLLPTAGSHLGLPPEPPEVPSGSAGLRTLGPSQCAGPAVRGRAAGPGCCPPLPLATPPRSRVAYQGSAPLRCRPGCRSDCHTHQERVSWAPGGGSGMRGSSSRS